MNYRDAHAYIRQHAYEERDMCVVLLARMALKLGLVAGMGFDQNGEPNFCHVCYIDLPAGQVSWHIHDSELPNFEGIPPYGKPFDGHSHEEKYQRVLMGV